MNYAITGATGHFGQSAVKNLLNLVNDNDNVIAIVRNIDKGSKVFPNGLKLRQGNYDNEESMEKALENVDRLLFISSQPGSKTSRNIQHKNVVKALKNAGIKFVAYTSFPEAQNSPSSLSADHKLTENLIKESGIAYSFLRNNWYLENEIGFLKSGEADQTALYWANNNSGWALEREYAEAAAKVLTANDPKQVYEFAGASRSYEDLGEALKKATGNDITIKQITRDEYIKHLESTGLDNNTAALFASFQEPIDDGALNENSTDLQKTLGHDLTDLPDAIKEILNRG
ncbi:MAG: SDR family oxidoreductase [Oenococcus oeni]